MPGCVDRLAQFGIVWDAGILGVIMQVLCPYVIELHGYKPVFYPYSRYINNSKI